MLDWNDYLYGFAIQAAKKSKDSTKVGAVLVSPEKSVLLTGYNGPAMGVRDIPERRERPMKYLFAVHAERNIINFAARHGIKTAGCSLYVTHCCCAQCMGSIIQAGIVNVFYGPGLTSMPDAEFIAAQEMAQDANINYQPIGKGNYD